MSDQTPPIPITQTPEQKETEAEAVSHGQMQPLGINVIGCGVCGSVKTATGATIADFHKLTAKQQTGPAQGNPAGLWARVVVPMYCCIDCTIELKVSDAECVKLVAESEEGGLDEVSRE